MANSAPWQGGPPKKKKKKGAATQGPAEENGIVPVPSRPTPMSFPPRQGCSTTLGSCKTDNFILGNKLCDGGCITICFCWSACGSNQPDALSIEYPLPSSSQPVYVPSQPLGKRKEAIREEKRNQYMLS